LVVFFLLLFSVILFLLRVVLFHVAVVLVVPVQLVVNGATALVGAPWRCHLLRDRRGALDDALPDGSVVARRRCAICLARAQAQLEG
jgi:hypothetical protein